MRTVVEKIRAVPSKIMETLIGRCPRKASSHSIKWAWLLRIRDNPNGKAMSAKDIRIADNLIA